MTKPVDDTMIVGLLLDHTTVRPVSVLPLVFLECGGELRRLRGRDCTGWGSTVTVCTGASTTVVFVPTRFHCWR